VAIGEVGLAGEVRRVTGVQRRLAEAARLGFARVLVPPDPGKVPAGMRVTEVADLGEALRVLPLQSVSTWNPPERSPRNRLGGPGKDPA
jgi:DNA repair protein RadA/Sms